MGKIFLKYSNVLRCSVITKVWLIYNLEYMLNISVIGKITDFVFKQSVNVVTMDSAF